VIVCAVRDPEVEFANPTMQSLIDDLIEGLCDARLMRSLRRRFRSVIWRDHGEDQRMDPVYLREAVKRPIVGLGFRPEFASDLMARPEVVDFVEVVAETCFTQRATRREACAVAEMWPIVPHGVKLSLGSADGVDLDRARRLGTLARELRAKVISEHVSFTRAGEVDIGHLTQLPRTREAIVVVANNVARCGACCPTCRSSWRTSRGRCCGPTTKWTKRRFICVRVA